MKKTIKLTTAILFSFAILLSLVSCNKPQQNKDIWKDAIYNEDVELGEGEKTVILEVKAEENSVSFTINTNAETVGEALKENNLVDGEKGAYGLYIKSVNGIVADYNADQSYWAFYKDGSYMQTGVDKAGFESGEHYELVYTK